MCFLGDFANLKLSTKTWYTGRWNILEQSLNCLVELKGTHRYKNCPVLQRIMPKMRNEGLKQIVKSWIQELSTGTKWKCQDRKIPASLHSIMPNDAASISMCSDRISRNTTLIALPITITFRKVPLSSNRKHFGVRVPLIWTEKYSSRSVRKQRLRAVK
jgi:hypothetical protein